MNLFYTSILLYFFFITSNALSAELKLGGNAETNFFQFITFSSKNINQLKTLQNEHGLLGYSEPLILTGGLIQERVRLVSWNFVMEDKILQESFILNINDVIKNISDSTKMWIFNSNAAK